MSCRPHDARFAILLFYRARQPAPPPCGHGIDGNARPGFERASLHVEPRSANLLAGEVRHQWEHSIVPGDRLRFSITFRTLSDLGRREAGLSPN